MFSPSQQTAFNSYVRGDNIFITGPGGCGKSYLIRKIYKHAKENNKKIQVTALTGCAAVLLNCNATTIHSWGNIGLGNSKVDDIIKNIYLRKKKDNWLNVNILIIDEISMMSAHIFELIDTIARRIRRCSAPFGGIQIIASGDFYQLPPVFNRNIPPTDKNNLFCFESQLWNETFHKQIMFYDNFRQQNDIEYQKILGEIRNNNLSIESIETLLSRTKQDTSELEIQPPIIYPLKRQVDKYNNEQFEKLKTNSSDIVKNYSTVFLKYNKTTRSYNTINKTAKTNQPIFNKCMNSLLVDENIKLLIGTQVMCIANIDIENNLVNGSQGIIMGFENNLPLVEFKVGEHKFIRKIEYYEWTLMDDQYMVKQLPLIMSWAITIHKSQGVTLNSARINIGSCIFEYGQTYVALSRVSSINGLYLDAVNINKIKTNPKVVKFYKSLI